MREGETLQAIAQAEEILREYKYAHTVAEKSLMIGENTNKGLMGKLKGILKDITNQLSK